MALALAITQMGCQAPPPTSRITVASAGRISSLDPAQASTLGATQLISALGGSALSPQAGWLTGTPPGGIAPCSE